MPGELTRIRDAPVPSNARCTIGGGGADHRGERGDLRGPPGGGQRCRRLPLRDGRGKGGLWEALAAEKAAEISALAAEASGRWAARLASGDSELKTAGLQAVIQLRWGPETQRWPM